jgi:hypothetical protein
MPPGDSDNHMELVRQKAYRKTFEIACSRLAGLPIEERLAAAGLPFRREGDVYNVTVPFFDEEIELTIPAFAFTSAKGSNITLTAKIVLLHYITEASGEPIGTELIPYEDIPGCRAYAPVFDRRVTKPLLLAFGFARDAFFEAGTALGGEKQEYGDVSFTLQALPRVPITFILWEGDADFPPSMKVLFDRSIHSYLPHEDIVVISKMAATRIIKEARKEYAED